MFKTFCVVLMCLGLTLPVFAQEVTPTVTPVVEAPPTVVVTPAASLNPSEIVLLFVIVFLSTIIMGDRLSTSKYIEKAFNAIPAEFRPYILQTLQDSVARLEPVVAASPNTIDDTFYANLKPLVIDILKELQSASSQDNKETG